MYTPQLRRHSDDGAAIWWIHRIAFSEWRWRSRDVIRRNTTRPKWRPTTDYWCFGMRHDRNWCHSTSSERRRFHVVLDNRPDDSFDASFGHEPMCIMLDVMFVAMTTEAVTRATASPTGVTSLTCDVNSTSRPVQSSQVTVLAAGCNADTASTFTQCEHVSARTPCVLPVVVYRESLALYDVALNLVRVICVSIRYDPKEVDFGIQDDTRVYWTGVLQLDDT